MLLNQNPHCKSLKDLLPFRDIRPTKSKFLSFRVEHSSMLSMHYIVCLRSKSFDLLIHKLKATILFEHIQ